MTFRPAHDAFGQLAVGTVLGPSHRMSSANEQQSLTAVAPGEN